jgi:Leucine-rich repeat (LRR) protein
MTRDQAYYEAEKKIEEARRSEATELILWNMELTELPEALNQLTQLRSLDVSYNRLISLPECFNDLTRLESLDISNNQLIKLPDSLSNLIQLQWLYLSYNKLTTLPEWIGQLTNLPWLDVSNNQLSWLPESLGKLTQLRSLEFSNNLLTALPEWIANLTRLQSLGFSNNQLTTLPDWIGNLTLLHKLEVSNNQLAILPNSIGKLTQLQLLNLATNQLAELPESMTDLSNLGEINLYQNKLIKLPNSIGNLKKLRNLLVSRNKLSELPESICNLHNLITFFVYTNELREIPERIGDLSSLRELRLDDNKIVKLPESIGNLSNLERLDIGTNNYGGNDLIELPISLLNIMSLRTLSLEKNPLNPELAAAYKEGLEAVKTYLRAKAKAQVILNEAKLILVGEGEVGKSCLLSALRDDPWEDGRPTTHGIEIKIAKVTDIDTQKEIILNGWDFGGQRVYRPTHQLFFSAAAVYLVVWKPREGPQQGFVKEWIQLVTRREPTAKILVVATHGGPQQRQPDIDRHELWDLFGKETAVDFFWVDNKPDKNGKRKGIEELKLAIAKVATGLPEVGRSVPKSFQDVREALKERNAPYLPLDEVLAICRQHKMDDEIAGLFIKVSHRLGHLTHYENDPTLRDIVILRPDWLATAMSYVLDDAETRKNQGLVKFSRLSLLWNDPARPADTRYPEPLHRIFLRLMERFDLSYRVAGLSKDEESNPVSLIAQLVPDTTPQEALDKAWPHELAPGDTTGDVEQMQICRIVDAGNGQSANAEGLFYQLIVRLHKFSLGRAHWDDSVHWQRGLVLDANYNGRALLRHVGNDIHITVRAPYPERFLAMLTEEVKYLVESFWEGLRCDVTVPCLNEKPCIGLFEVSKLIENKKRGRPEVPCSICNEWQSINQLLSNAPAATQPVSLETLLKEFAQVKDTLNEVNDNTRRILSQVDKSYADLINLFTDEAKEGPRLFSIFPLDRSVFNPKGWIRAPFRLVLWCEHSRLPLPVHNGIDSKKGVYDFELEREWFKKAAPYLKLLTGTLSLVLPVASSTLKVVDNDTFKTMENQLGLGKSIIDGIAGESKAINEFIGEADSTKLEHDVAIRAENATLRELHTLLKGKDPGFGGLVRVMNKRQEFLWVHEKFASEY